MLRIAVLLKKNILFFVFCYSKEPRLDEVYNLLAYPILWALIMDVDTNSANQNSGIGAPPFGERNVAVDFSARIILQMCGLNTGIGKSYHAYALRMVLFQQPTISLTHELFLIGYGFIGEKFVEIRITA